MDAFFVSVEELFDPSLKGKPVVVGGRPERARRGLGGLLCGAQIRRPLGHAPADGVQALPPGHLRRRPSGTLPRLLAPGLTVLQAFSPLVEMASIDEAYLDMTGTERLYGPPLRAAHLLHQRMKTETRLNCSIGIATSRLVAKITSDQAKPNGVLWVIPGQEAAFLAPLDVRKVPGVGKVTEKNLHSLGIRKVGDLARLDEAFLEQRFGKWGMALAGKSRGLDAGGWFDQRSARMTGRNPSATNTPSTRTRPTWPGSSPHCRGSAKWWAGACASMACRAHHPTEAALSGFLDHHAPHSVPRATSSIPNCTRRSARSSSQLEARRQGAVTGRTRIRVGRRGATGSAGRRAPRALETGAGGRRPDARPLRRIGGVAGGQHARKFQRAHARKPGGAAGEEKNVELAPILFTFRFLVSCGADFSLRRASARPLARAAKSVAGGLKSAAG